MVNYKKESIMKIRKILLFCFFLQLNLVFGSESGISEKDSETAQIKTEGQIA